MHLTTTQRVASQVALTSASVFSMTHTLAQNAPGFGFCGDGEEMTEEDGVDVTVVVLVGVTVVE